MNITFGWFHNDVPLLNENNRILWLERLNRTQSGTYHCSVSTRYRKQTSGKKNVFVNCECLIFI